MAIELTDAAINRMHALSVKRQTSVNTLKTSIALYRIGIKGGGCSGMSYFIDFADVEDPKDKVFEFGADDNKVKVLIDRKSYLFLNGIVIDWKSTLMKSGFEFNNPVAKRSCSCGESFSV